jgi:uncharacterized protein YjiS (DUF1127 family)
MHEKNSGKPAVTGPMPLEPLTMSSLSLQSAPRTVPAAGSRAAASYSVLVGVARAARSWIERCKQRRALAELDDRLLDDVGLSREQARGEIAKPFWRR